MEFIKSQKIRIRGHDGAFTINDIDKVAFFDPVSNPCGSTVVPVCIIDIERYLTYRLTLKPNRHYKGGAYYYPKEGYLIDIHKCEDLYHIVTRVGNKQMDTEPEVLEIPDKYRYGNSITLLPVHPIEFKITWSEYVAYIDIDREKLGVSEVTIDKIPKREDITLRLELVCKTNSNFKPVYYPDRKLLVNYTHNRYHIEILSHDKNVEELK